MVMNRALGLLCFLSIAASLHAWGAPFTDQINQPGDPISYAFEPVNGRVAYNKRTGRNLSGVTDADRVYVEAALMGEIRVSASGFKPGTYRLVFGNAELRAHSRFNRTYDIIVNGETLVSAYNHFERFGMFAAGTVSVEAVTQDGTFTIEYRKTDSHHDRPRFCYVRFFDSEGAEVSTFSALRLEPPDYIYSEYSVQRPSRVRNEYVRPPFEPSYKIRLNETDRLTPADIVGPDGIVYPNWTRVGIEGGIPEVTPVARLAEFGAGPDSGQDVSDALEAAARAAGEAGGGAVQLEAGTYFLDRPVFIRHDGVVIRGAGRDRTRLVFRYRAPERGVDVFTLPGLDGSMGPSSQLFASGHPDELRRVALEVDGELLSELKDLPVGTYQFMTYSPSWRIMDRFGPGLHTVTAIAEYYTGEVSREVREIDFVDGVRHENQLAFPGQLAAINFMGGGPLGSMALLASDAVRGSMTIELVDGHGLVPGDRITIHAPATKRWKALVRTEVPWGDFRRNIVAVTAVESNRVTLEDPLRISFPVVDGSYVQKIDFIDRVGVEDLHIEQSQRLWTNGIFFHWAWESWMQQVDVTMAGRHAFYFVFGKRCEIRDCVFDRTWYDLGGGTSYLGFERDFDCLMENVTARDMRHGPNLQWASAGNVFRNCHFIGSDAQYHAGWTHENLFENCVIDSGYQNGSYGFGIYSSAPEAGAHGPTGPRNVVYNCDIASPSVGFRMGGMNENFIVAYNRFIVGKGPAVSMRHASFDHIIRGNVFVVEDPWPAVFYLGTRDCIGIELVDNTIIGPVSVLVTGQAKPLLERNNNVQRNGNIERPRPKVPSIFAWQQKYGAKQLAGRRRAAAE